jgi:hypothetical protein
MTMLTIRKELALALVDMLGGQPRRRGSAGNPALEGIASANSATQVVDEVAPRHPHDDLVISGALLLA